MIELAPRTVQNIPHCLRRQPITVLQPASMTPVPTNTLQARSVPDSLAGWLPAPQNALVAVASQWPGFLKLGRTMLLACGFHPDTLVFRDARKKNWQRGLEEMAAVVSDCVTAADLRSCKTRRVVVFGLLSEASIRELQDYVKFLL